MFRTKQLDAFAAMDLAARAQTAVAAVPKDLLARTAAFLLLKDSNPAMRSKAKTHPRAEYKDGEGRLVKPDGMR